MLDCRDYDIAILNRIKTFFNNTHWVTRPNISIKEIRDRKLLEGKDVAFPLVVVRRTNCPIISQEYNSWSRANTGVPYNTNPNQNVPLNLRNHDPELAQRIIAESNGHYDGLTVVNSTFNLQYFIDVISFERDNFDTIMIELQENLFRVPYLSFNNIKANGTIDKLVKGQACHLLLESVEDVSDLENFDNGNALYRAVITVKVNAYIYRKYKAKAVESINLPDLHEKSGYYWDAELNTWKPIGYHWDATSEQWIPDGHFWDDKSQLVIPEGYLYNSELGVWYPNPLKEHEPIIDNYVEGLTISYEVHHEGCEHDK